MGISAVSAHFDNHRALVAYLHEKAAKNAHRAEFGEIWTAPGVY